MAHPSFFSSNLLAKDLLDLPVITENYQDTGDAWKDFLKQYQMSFKDFKNCFEIRDATPALVGAVLAGLGG